jgi:GDSL-like lipase/acylhydrolase family protein
MVVDDAATQAAAAIPRRKRIAFTVVMMAISATGIGVLWVAERRLVLPSGEPLNRLAWEANFSERGLPVPAGGPRDGYWGARMPPQTKDPDLGWVEAEAHIPGLVDEDAAGLQRVGRADAPSHLLILGGSVAWGAYASSAEATYFARLGRWLEAQGSPVRITVLAAGAWTSDHEVKALELRSLALEPDVVMILDGLNDFTLGNAPEDDRVAAYLARMREAGDLARARGIAVVFVLQPTLLQKSRSRIEDRILELSLDAAAETRVRNGYARIRTGLRELSRSEGAAFIDASDAFAAERATTFTDLWHFADPGHALLAERITRPLLDVLRRRGRVRHTYSTPKESSSTGVVAM